MLKAKLVYNSAKSIGHKNVHYVPNIENIKECLDGLVKSNDMIITIGAGTIWRYGQAYFNHLKNLKNSNLNSIKTLQEYNKRCLFKRRSYDESIHLMVLAALQKHILFLKIENDLKQILKFANKNKISVLILLVQAPIY